MKIWRMLNFKNGSMAKGLIGGMTDYSNQSLSDIIEDLNSEYDNITECIETIEGNMTKVEESDYWNNIPSIFIRQILYSLRHYRTTQEELSEIVTEINVEVKKHHIKRLQKISQIADKINISIGKTWHQQYEDKDYDNQSFRIVERIYVDTRGMAVSLLDMSNIAGRLNDYVGKTSNIKNDFGISVSNSKYVSIVSQSRGVQINQTVIDDVREQISKLLDRLTEEDVDAETKETITECANDIKDDINANKSVPKFKLKILLDYTSRFASLANFGINIVRLLGGSLN